MAPDNDILVSLMDDALKENRLIPSMLYPRLHQIHMRLAEVIRSVVDASQKRTYKKGLAKQQIMDAVNSSRRDLLTIHDFAPERVDKILTTSLSSVSEYVEMYVGFSLRDGSDSSNEIYLDSP